MNTPAMAIAEASPRLKARIAGGLYLLTIIMGGAALFLHGKWNFAADLFAGACYIVVTLLFYDIFKPVNRKISFVAAFFSLVGIKMGGSKLDGVDIGLVCFGIYCLLIGYLIFKSTFLPKVLGALMAFAGLGWLTSLSPPLATYLSPYNLAPGILGETFLCVWLMATGLNAERWKEQAYLRSVS